MHMKILELKDKYLYYFIYLFSLLISIVLIFLNVHLAVYGLFWILGFGWSLFFFNKKFNVLIHFLLSPVLFISVFLPFTVLFAFGDIKLTISVGIAFVVLSTALFVWKKIFEEGNLDLKISKFDYVALLIFAFAVAAKILSIRNFYVPGLHDPISHTYFAKQIMNTGLIEYFYSPGIHILGAFSTMFNGFDVARQILFETNFFNAYVGIIAYIFIQKVFNKPVWALSSALLLCLGDMPALLFVNAGKNSLIVAFSILFFIALLLFESRKMSDWKNILISALAFFAIFITHYPLAVIACILLFVVFLVDIKKNWLQNLLIGIGILLGFLLMYKTYPYLIEQSNDSVMSANSVPLFTIPIDFWGNVKGYVKYISDRFTTTLPVFTVLLTFGTELGLLIGGIKAFKNSNVLILILWFLISVLSVGVLWIFGVSSLWIIIETFGISLFLFLYLFSGFAFNFLYDFVKEEFNLKVLMNIVLICFILITPLLAFKTYKTFYNRSEAHNMVSSSDIEAFNWIKDNMSSDSKILINTSWGNNHIPAPTDGGGWIEIFTDRKISSPFYDFASKETDNNANLYVRLKNNLNDCDAINTLIDNGYKYYYQGSKPVFDTRLGDKENLLQSGKFNILFSNGESIVYEILPCN